MNPFEEMIPLKVLSGSKDELFQRITQLEEQVKFLRDEFEKSTKKPAAKKKAPAKKAEDKE